MVSQHRGFELSTLDIGSLSDGRVLLAFGGNSRFDATVNTALHDATTDTLGPVTLTLSALSNLGGPPDGNFSVATQPFWRGASTDAHT